jgi:hypothetical protein
MRKLRITLATLVAATPLVAASRVAAGPPDPPASTSSQSSAAALDDYARLPLAFTPVGDGTYQAGLPGAHASVGATGASIGGLDLEVVGAREEATATPLDRLPGVVNDLRGTDPSAWRTDIPTSARVRFESVYPGVDLDWHGNGEHLEYDFRLDPGVSADVLAVRFDRPVHQAPNGDLVIGDGEDATRQLAPEAWQVEPDGERSPVEVAFSLRGRTVGFEIGEHLSGLPLVIDPVVLTHSTLLGGDGIDQASGIDVDLTGAAYLTGSTVADEQSTTGDDAFVTKINPAGTAFVYSTYLGGNATDDARGIAVDSSGAAVVVGVTNSQDFNLVKPYQTARSSSESFISRLSPAGDRLTFSTLLGGDQIDEANAVAVDGGGAAWVTGFTDSSDFDQLAPLDTNDAGRDAWVARFSSAGALQFSTTLGGTADDEGDGIDVDPAGSAYVAGTTDSSNLDTLNPYEGNSPGQDAFVTKITNANVLAYSTYVGGSDDEHTRDVAVDPSGSAYVVGNTLSIDFDRVGGVEGDDTFSDGFLAKLAPGGNALVYSTYLGGSREDGIEGVAVDALGSAYVTGLTNSDHRFNLVRDLALDQDSAGYDVFVSRFTPTGGELVYSIVSGDTSSDRAQDIAVDLPGDAYVTGYPPGVEHPLRHAVLGSGGGGFGDDAFAAKIRYVADA